MVAAGRYGFTVAPEDAGTRLDVYVAEQLGELSRTRAQKLIRDGAITVDGESLRGSARLRSGQEVAVEIPPPVPLALEPEDIPLEVLHEDEAVAVVNKPAGMPVHPGPGHASGTLVHALLAQVSGLSGIGGAERPGIVHRLDKDTSGVLVIAKNDAAHLALAQQFARHSVGRRYLAVVLGEPPDAGEIEGAIGRHPTDRKRFAVVERGGRWAKTHFEVIERLGPCAVLELRLETGRTHQIRVHCLHREWPVLGDPVYGPRRLARIRDAGAKEAVAALSRQMLHARLLAFDHPVRGERLTFEVEPPADMNELLAALRAAYAE